ncbi:MAG: Holliday junction resolvase RuvX [Salinisphaera sp.]|nr:Holliday junction resolvase RuvX [Salinisphaera sp.]
MPDGVVLGFDFGTRRIGVAVGNTLSANARPLTTLPAHDAPDWPAIANLLESWRPTALVVGLPLDAAGHEQLITGQARAFMHELGLRSGLPVHGCDERYSSLAAQTGLRAARALGTRSRRLRKADTDAAAACIILDAWLADGR